MLFPAPSPPPALRPGPALHLLTREEFMGRQHLVEATIQSQLRYFDAVLPPAWREMEATLASDRPRNLVTRFELAPLEGYQLMLFPPHHMDHGLVVALAPDGAVAGMARQGLGLAVHPEHRGKGLATELMLTAYTTGLKHAEEGLPLSAGGYATLVAVHRLAVRRAWEAGEHLRPEVLEDYPELTAATANSLPQDTPEP